MTDAGGSLEKLHRRFGTKAKRRLQIVTLRKKFEKEPKVHIDISARENYNQIC